MAQPTYLEYWQQFCQTLTDRGSLVCFEPQEWYYLRHRWKGKNIRLSPVACERSRYVGVEVILEGPHAKERFASLQEQCKEIDRELGEPVCWRGGPAQKQCDIKLRWEGCDPSDQTQWAEQHNWLYAKLQLFHAVFAHRIEGLP